MKIDQYTVGPLGTNCYLLTCEKTGKSAIVDPGGMTPGLSDAIKRAKVGTILLTHGHFDHTEAIPSVFDLTGATLSIHEHDVGYLTDSWLNGSQLFGEPFTIDTKPVILHDGDSIAIGEESVSVMHTPGHTRGCVVFAVDDTVLLGGDTLFRMSVGRCDLTGGDFSAIQKSLRKILDAFPDSMSVYPGHGPATTIGFERRSNPFVGEN